MVMSTLRMYLTFEFVCEYFSSFCESEFAFEMHTTMGKKVFQFFKRWLTLESVGSKGCLVGGLSGCESGFDHFGDKGPCDMVAGGDIRGSFV